jgi:hypothetical protein
MLANYYSKDRINGIQSAIGKTDGFIFTDTGSSQVIELWSEGKQEEARKIMDEYVLRITAEVSSNS